MAAANSTEDIRRATEARLARAVEEMLERSLGVGHVRVEAAVAMDFDRIQETQEKFDPDGQVVRSTQTSSDNSKTSEAAQTTSVQNNLPNADAGANAAGSQQAKQDETTNYEIGKTVRTVLRDQPQIHKISLAVMVDGLEERGPDGVAKWQERSPADLAKIARLVQSAIGYDEGRGDHVEVATMRFALPQDAGVDAAAGLFGFSFDKADLMRLSQTGLMVVAALVALLMVVRPTVNRLIALAPAGAAGGLSLPGAAAAGGRGQALAGTRDAAAMLAAGMDPAQALLTSGHGNGDEDDGLVTLAKVDGQLRASSLRRLTDLVDKHPDETLAIIRGWIQEPGT